VRSFFRDEEEDEAPNEGCAATGKGKLMFKSFGVALVLYTGRLVADRDNAGKVRYVISGRFRKN
jgi:hypothetical protein